MDPKVIDFFNQLQQAAGHAGQQVLKIAVLSMYWQSVTCLTMGGVLTLVGIFLFIFGYRRVKDYCKSDPELDVLPFYIVVDFLVGSVGLLSLIAGLANALNPMNWVGTFAPRVALFYQIYEKLINK